MLYANFLLGGPIIGERSVYPGRRLHRHSPARPLEGEAGQGDRRRLVSFSPFQQVSRELAMGEAQVSGNTCSQLGQPENQSGELHGQRGSMGAPLGVHGVEGVGGDP